MRLILPRLFFSENNGKIQRRAAIFRGTFHYCCIFILDNLFGRIGKETFDKKFESSTYHSLCQTSGIESWKEIDYYFSHITKKINLDRVLNNFEKCDLYLKRLRNDIVNPLAAVLKNNGPESKLLGLVAISLEYDGKSSVSATGLPGLPILSKNRLKSYAGKRHFLRYVRQNITQLTQYKVPALVKPLIQVYDLCDDYDKTFCRQDNTFLNLSTHFLRTKHTPSDKNLKKLSIPTAFIHIYDISRTFELSAEQLEIIQKDCVELFQFYTYAAYKLRAFECAGQREGDFDKNLQAIELASEVSFLEK